MNAKIYLHFYPLKNNLNKKILIGSIKNWELEEAQINSRGKNNKIIREKNASGLGFSLVETQCKWNGEQTSSRDARKVKSLGREAQYLLFQ